MNEVTFAYPKNLASAHPNFVQAHQGAYWETAQEDEAIGRSIQAGRHFLWSRNRDESGPVHPTLEAGIIKFHDWLMGAFKGAPE
jgi:choline monooxygenase